MNPLAPLHDHSVFKQLCIPLALALSLAASTPQAAGGLRFQQRNLVSDGSIPAAHADPNLVNGWGVAFNPFGFVWVADADGIVSTLYDGDGNVQSLVVQIPEPDAATGGEPTGIVFNGSNNFVVSKGGVSGPSRFMFATEDGVIAGWAPNVDLTHAIRVVDGSASGANYKGLALSAGWQHPVDLCDRFLQRTRRCVRQQFPPGGVAGRRLHTTRASRRASRRSASRRSAGTSTSPTPSRTRA